ncbi:MAG: hypothetical protein N2201_02295 [candidate division WOR-3 bacterium]|nr:hypothetical protein [candidate division WOR-3 bacterium]
MSAGLLDIVGKILGNLPCYPIDNLEVKPKGNIKGNLKIYRFGSRLSEPVGCRGVCPSACPPACRPARPLGNQSHPSGLTK